MKATSDSTRNPTAEHHLTRRQALSGTAAAAVVALPAGGAMLAGELPAISSQAEKKFDPEAFRRFARLGSADHPLLAAWHEMIRVGKEYDDDPDADTDHALWHRLTELYATIEHAQPTDPVGLAVQLRYLAYDSAMGADERQPLLADLVADRLAAMAGVEIVSHRA